MNYHTLQCHVTTHCTHNLETGGLSLALTTTWQNVLYIDHFTTQATQLKRNNDYKITHK